MPVCNLLSTFFRPYQWIFCMRPTSWFIGIFPVFCQGPSQLGVVRDSVRQEGRALENSLEPLEQQRIQNGQIQQRFQSFFGRFKSTPKVLDDRQKLQTESFAQSRRLHLSQPSGQQQQQQQQQQQHRALQDLGGNSDTLTGQAEVSFYNEDLPQQQQETSSLATLQNATIEDLDGITDLIGADTLASLSSDSAFNLSFPYSSDSSDASPDPLLRADTYVPNVAPFSVCNSGFFNDSSNFTANFDQQFFNNNNLDHNGFLQFQLLSILVLCLSNE